MRLKLRLVSVAVVVADAVRIVAVHVAGGSGG